MELIIVCGVLLVVAAGIFLFGATAARQAWADKRAVQTREQEVAEATSVASWRVGVHHMATNTFVVVHREAEIGGVRRPVGNPVNVARIAQDSPEYEVELQRASATARQRAMLFNGLIDAEKEN